MKSRDTPGVGWISAGVLSAAVIGMITWSLLGALSTPPRLAQRLDRIDANVARVDAAGHGFSDLGAYLPRAVCHEAIETAGANLRQSLQQAAAASGLTAPSVQVSPPDTMDVTGRLTPILFEIDASGGYDAMIALLQRLAGAEPQIFADTLDLKSQAASVQLKLTGRVLCSPSQA